MNDVYTEAVVKTALYADDTKLFLQNEKEMSNALSIVEGVFSNIWSGNKTKLEAMWLGTKSKTKQCAETFLNFVWKTKLKILGDYFCNDKCASCVEENSAERIQAIKRLTLHGKKKCKYCWIDRCY